MKNLSLVVVAVVFSAAVLAAQKFDLTGEWIFEVQTDQGSGSPTIILKQDGDKLTGRYKGQLGDSDITTRRLMESILADTPKHEALLHECPHGLLHPAP